MRVAALDCGTNTLRLLIADLDLANRSAREVVRRSEIVRLGQRVDQTGEFAPAALERTFATLAGYRALIEEHGVAVSHRRIVATSASRDVRNRDAFVRGVVELLGVEPEVVSGEDEAGLTYDGATRDLPPDLPEPVLVLDIGGGSTELVMADPDTGRVHGVSLDIGSVRLTERHLHGDPPGRDEIAAVTSDVDTALDTVGSRFGDARTLVGVAGTVMTVGATALDLTSYDKQWLHLARLPRSDVEAAVDRLLAMTVAERRDLPFMAPGRADVIIAGGIILRRVMERTGVGELVPSIHDILDGIAWRIAADDG